MPKNLFVRTVSIVLVVGILALTVPTLKSADSKATSKSSIIQILKQPMILLSTLFASSSAVATQNSGKLPAGSSVSNGRVKPTGDLPIYRPATGD